jgi:hypothetical protein
VHPIGRRIGLASLGAFCAVAALPGAAAGADGSVAGTAPVPRDVVLDRPLHTRGLATDYAPYPDGDGHTVQMDRGSYSDADARTVAAELGALVHGAEMNRLSVLLVTDLEMQLICGANVLACYDPRAEEMVIVGHESTEPPSRAFLVAHEYGHHVETNRRNDPWNALEWGTKRWATQQRVCPGVRAGQYKPGAYGAQSYYDNPGEAFAEAYAFLHFPNHVRWDWNFPEPDGESFDAIHDDVTEPWDGTERVTRDGKLKKRGDKDGAKIGTPLDGDLHVRLDGSKNDDFDLRVLDSSRDDVLDRAKGPGADESLDFEVCGERKVYVEAVSREGKGKFEIRAKRP